MGKQGNHDITVGVKFEADQQSVASIQNTVANVAQAVSVNYNMQQGTQSAGGASKLAAGAAAKSASSQSAVPGPVGITPPSPSIPSPVSSGTLPSVTRPVSSQSGSFSDSEVNNMLSILNSAMSNLGGGSGVPPAGTPPVVHQPMYPSQAGPHRPFIPSQSSLAFTQAYSSQSQYSTPSAFAGPYAQQIFEDRNAAKWKRDILQENRSELRADSLVDRAYSRIDTSNRRMARIDERGERSLTRASSRIEELRLNEAYKSLNNMSLGIEEDTGFINETGSVVNLKDVVTPARESSILARYNQKEFQRQRRIKRLRSQVNLGSFTSGLEQDITTEELNDAQLAADELSAKISSDNLSKRGRMNFKRKNRLVKEYQGEGYTAADINMSDEELYDFGTDVRSAKRLQRLINARNKSLSPDGPGGITRAQVNNIYNAETGNIGSRTSISDAGIRMWANAAPQSMGPSSPLYPMSYGPPTPPGAPTLTGGFANPGNYQFGSPGQMMAIRQQFINALPGYGMRFAKGALVAGGEFAAAEAQAQVSYISTGRRDMGAEAGAQGGLVGGLVGAGIGSLFPGYGTVIGAGIGSQVGSQVANYTVAEQIKDITMQRGLLPAASLAASYAGDYGSWTRVRNPDRARMHDPGMTDRYVNPVLGGVERMTDRANKMADIIGKDFWSRGKTTTDKDGKEVPDYTQYYMTPQDLAKTYGSAYGALIEAGINPEQMTRGGFSDATIPGSRGDAAIREGERNFDRSGGIDKIFGIPAAQVAIGNAINFRDRFKTTEQQSLYTWLAENADKRWGDAGRAIFDKSVAPIIAGINQTGGNIADILMKHGVSDTDYFVQDTTVFGDNPRVGLKDLMRVSSNQQTLSRIMQFSETFPRSQGSRAVSSLSTQQENIASLPGGSDSLTFAQLGEQKRRAQLQAYREQDIMSYGLPMSALEGQEQRRQYLPNMPGYGLVLSMQRMGMRAPYIQQRQSRYAAQVASGSLTEEEQLGQFNEIQGLMTEQARDLGHLAEGGQDRALAFSGGRPSFFGRMNSISLARTAVWNRGSPQVGFGARNGQQLQYQNDFFSQFDSPGFHALDALNPKNLSGPMSYPGAATGVSQHQQQKMVELLEQMVKLMQGSSTKNTTPGGGARTGEALGNLNGNLQSSTFNARASYGRGQQV
jgi:hypothetical protein